MLKAAIDDAGYDIVATPTVESVSPLQLGWSNSLAGLAGIASPRHMKHLDNCEKCRTEYLGRDGPVHLPEIPISTRCVLTLPLASTELEVLTLACGKH